MTTWPATRDGFLRSLFPSKPLVWLLQALRIYACAIGLSAAAFVLAMAALQYKTVGFILGTLCAITVIIWLTHQLITTHRRRRADEARHSDEGGENAADRMRTEAPKTLSRSARLQTDKALYKMLFDSSGAARLAIAAERAAVLAGAVVETAKGGNDRIQGNNARLQAAFAAFQGHG